MMTRADTAFHAMTEPTTPMATKLYGQISPKIQGGGCHAGLSSARYHVLPVETHAPDPTAYTTMVMITAVTATTRQVMSRVSHSPSTRALWSARTFHSGARRCFRHEASCL